VRDERGEPPRAVRGTGAVDVAEDERPRRGSGQGGQLVGPQARGLDRFWGDCSGRTQRTLGERRAVTVLVTVPPVDRLEAHVDHADVFPVAALQRHLRDAVVLHRRTPVVQGPIGRLHPVAVHVRRPRAGRCGLCDAAQHRSQATHDRLQQCHGRVSPRHNCLHARV